MKSTTRHLVPALWLAALAGSTLSVRAHVSPEHVAHPETLLSQPAHAMEHLLSLGLVGLCLAVPFLVRRAGLRLSRSRR